MVSATDLRRSITTLTDLAGAEVAELWTHLTSFAEARVALNDVMPALVETYGQAAAAVAAEWYDDLRDQQDVRGRFRAVPASIAQTGTSALVGWAASEASDLGTMQALVIGGMTRRIADWSRLTVMDSTRADPRADGWQRVARLDGCAFCVMFAGRGYVYTESTVRFASHDSCHCTAAPKWAGQTSLVDVEEYRASERRRSDETREKDNTRAREWIANNL